MSVAVVGEGFDDLVGGLGPDAGLGFSFDPMVRGGDVFLELEHGSAGRALELAAGQIGERAWPRVLDTGVIMQRAAV